MEITGFDHIVLCVQDVPKTLDFYGRILGMEIVEERPGKFSVRFGSNKISIQDAGTRPILADKTVPGSGNFCLLTKLPIGEVAENLRSHDVEIVEGPAERQGAVGKLMSIYFHDPDGNLVEISNRMSG